MFTTKTTAPLHEPPTRHLVRDHGPQRHTSTPTQHWQRSLGNIQLQAPHSFRIQRACACGGSCANCQSKDDERRRLQPQLRVGPVDDIYERQADQVANRVTHMSGGSTSAADAGSTGVLPIQRIAAGDNAGQAVDANLNLDQSGGQPLDATTRTYMEPRFGRDFSQVRLHSDQQAQRSAAQIQARAFTYGNHIWLGQGESQQNHHLMAHELTHVVQQGAAHDMASNTKVQREPQAQCPNGTKTIAVDFVSLRGSSRNPVDDLAFANSVFRPCCVQFVMGTGLSAGATDSDTWLGGDTVMSRDPACGAIHAEETATYDGATATFGLSSRMRVFYVESITPADRAFSIPPFCATGPRAPYSEVSVVTNSAASRSLAHEFGHILLNSGDHTGIDNPADTSNLMIPTNTATGETLDASQCATIFANA